MLKDLASDIIVLFGHTDEGRHVKASKLLDEYQRLYKEDPFSEDTIQAGLELNDLIKSE